MVYYDWRKPDELVKKLRKLSENKIEAERIAAEGQRIAEENMTVETFTEIIKEKIESVLKNAQDREE